MGRAVASTDAFKVVNISQARVKSVTRIDCGAISQWVVPFEPLRNNGLPSNKTVAGIIDVVSSVQPDLIHVWGIENYWGLLTARKLLPQPALLELQGIKHAIAPHMMGGLSFSEILGCMGLKELLRPSCSLFAAQVMFRKARRFEREMLNGHPFISYQSEWVRAYVERVSSGSRLFPTRMMLRSEFSQSQPWHTKNEALSPVIFTSSSGADPYKGLHVVLRAISILKSTFPQIRLNVAGAQFQSGMRQSGYSRWLLREVRRLGISENVSFVGALDALGIIEQFHNSSVVVVPSFVESYSLALVEAMAVGVPVVVSYAGAMPELARHGESALYFQPGDEVMCAWQIKKVLTCPSLAARLSSAAREVGLLRNNPDDVLKRQVQIYEEVLSRCQA